MLLADRSRHLAEQLRRAPANPSIHNGEAPESTGEPQ